MNIVLVHGILGFDRVGPFNYFNGVGEHLRQTFGAKVHAVKLHPTAGVEIRSNLLRESIQAALSRGELDPAEPIYIIAHSMGGLDSRRMISRDCFIQPNVPVKALATIGTPHRGSPVADAVALKLVPKTAVVSALLEVATRKLGDVLQHFDVSLAGLHDLTTAVAEQFNLDFPDNTDVKYISYAGGGRGGLFPTSRFFLACHAFILLVDGEGSDGVVGLSSAKWGEFVPDLWPSDHADEIGHNLDHAERPVDPKILARYDAIVVKFGAQ